MLFTLILLGLQTNLLIRPFSAVHMLWPCFLLFVCLSVWLWMLPHTFSHTWLVHPHFDFIFPFPLWLVWASYFLFQLFFVSLFIHLFMAQSQLTGSFHMKVYMCRINELACVCLCPFILFVCSLSFLCWMEPTLIPSIPISSTTPFLSLLPPPAAPSPAGE